MDDPWDVKSVRPSGLYTSCMKLNGVPLLPPVLSKECRKEMQYYKLLAREVEKRISILKPYVLDTDSSDEKTDASEMPECEQNCEIYKENIHVEKMKMEQDFDELLTKSPLHTELYNVSSEVDNTNNASSLIVDDNSTIKNNKKFKEVPKRNKTLPVEVPERDYNCTKSPELLIETDAVKSKQREKIIKSIVNYSFSVTRDVLSDSFTENISQDGPQSLSSKSFTGSLNNIHSESSKDSHNVSKLVRQRSYTLLNPSPQLLAHLEVQSLNTGVEMSCISMSDSLNNLYTPNKKRRSWDLESAKVKWSNMAKELKQKDMENPLSPYKHPVKRQPSAKAMSPPRAKSVLPGRTRQNSLSSKSPPLTTEPLYRNRKPSPVRIPSNRTMVKEPIKNTSTINNIHKKPQEPTSPRTPKDYMPSKTLIQKKDKICPRSPTNNPLISESEDPATKVRELYEKVQKQQLIQMSSLVEKQKREQLLLQQVFEEQNNLLFKQLKTICPKSPIEVKQAWGEKSLEGSGGPVSLSQLINHKSPDHPISDNPVSTLNNSNKYINHCDSVLKKSRDISGNIKRQGKSQSQNGNKIQSPRTQPEVSRTRTSSPNRRITPTSRRLNYDTSSSDREYDPILTDRTNDTMADLNVTFPSDSEDLRPYNITGMGMAVNDLTVIHTCPTPNSARSTDSAIKCMEQTIQNSMNSSRRGKVVDTQPTSKQQAAATKIVAHAKGYLIRRLMKTARVQATVQTIRDALVCALQLHQDREGIRGADVDLHRRLIQQITAACYSLHDTFITSTASERCSLIANDRERGRRASFAARPPPKHRHSDIMSQSHSGVFPSRPKRFSSSTSLMTQSNYESSNEKTIRARYMPSPRRRPWR